MSENNIKILLVEDAPTDAELIEMELEAAGISFDTIRVETQEDFLLQLSQFKPDLIISDFTLPRFNALHAIKLKNDLQPAIPFILVTGAQSEEIAVDCIKKGADDYILKSSLTRLPTSVLNTLRKKKAEIDSANALEELRLREEKYRNLFENSLVGMFRAQKGSWALTEVNEKAKQILGYHQLEGLSFKDLQFKNEQGNLWELLTSSNPYIENFEIQFTRPDKVEVWLSVSVKQYENELIIEGVILDITNNKNSWIELEKANYELDRFTYHASHDLKSPLRSLEGLIQAAMEEEGLEDIRTCLKMMQKSTTKLENLINDLLSLARTKNSEPKISPIDFTTEVSDCLSQLTFMDDFDKIDIRTRIIQNSTFYTDAVRVKIILSNLVSNAIKYHRFDQEFPYVSIQINTSERSAEIIIEDNGSGIEERHLSKLFDMFYRASNSAEGTGLGLYLVKSTIEKLGGNIDIKSEPHVGTKFIVNVPNLMASAPNAIAKNNFVKEL